MFIKISVCIAIIYYNQKLLYLTSPKLQIFFFRNIIKVDPRLKIYQVLYPHVMDITIDCQSQ